MEKTAQQVSKASKPTKASNFKPKLQKGKAKLYATIYGNPAKDMKIIAVTGTTGKDTVAHMIHEIIKTLDPKAGLILSTPDNPLTAKTLQKQLSDSWKIGANHVIVTAPATSLENYAFHTIPIHMAILTDIQGNQPGNSTTDQYAATKAILFQSQPYFSILNHDDPYYDFFAKYPAKTALHSYGRHRDATVRINHSKLYKKGTEANLGYNNTNFDLATFVAGESAVSYMAAATMAALALGFSPEVIADGIANYEP